MAYVWKRNLDVFGLITFLHISRKFRITEMAFLPGRILHGSYVI